MIVGTVGCQKEKQVSVLPEESVVFADLGNKDTVQVPLSILKDSAIVRNILLALQSDRGSNGHQVSLAIDTTKLLEYTSRYGVASLLPRSSYLFYKKDVKIPVGGKFSEPAELNIGLQTKLKEYSTYVLPVVIHSVDGKIGNGATERTLYLVFKTGKPLFINRQGWSIAAFSSQQGTFAPANVIDNNDSDTYWASNVMEKMPQWLTIDFKKEITFTGLSYYLPTILNYPSQGGYPTSFQVEVSSDGNTWTDKGIYTDDIAKNQQTVILGETKAHYLRFSVLSAVKYAKTYDAVFISGISLIP